ncbi:sodium:proton exchanger [bacterium]|nr:sodium:proton exchanger [bacterium]
MLELAGILVLGIFAQWLAWRIKQPAILPLIIIGLLVGPISTLFTEAGDKWLDGDLIFTGDLLFSFVSISVGVILFEGGLTLRFKELKSQAGTVRNLLFIGMIGTFLMGGVAAHYLMDLGWRISFLFGSLIIVSGPTVVLPILRNVKPNAKINTILKWEGILIDPFGALVAVLVYEVIKSGEPGESYTFEMLQEFFITVSSGVVAGAISAGILWYLLAKNQLPKYLRNVFTLGLVILTFAFAELIHKEAGLMATTVMGIILANTQLEELKKILSFKEDVVLILISVLFILLSSRINMEEIATLGWPSLLLFLAVIFVIRPVCVWLGTINSDLNWREKLFVSWIAPRGIVAAAVASLFSLQLTSEISEYNVEREEAFLLLPLTFLIIVGTVVVQGSTAKAFARALGVLRKVPNGIVLVGASEMARIIGKRLSDEGFDVVLADTSHTHIADAKALGLETYEGNILADQVFEELDLSRVGKLLATTSNSGINTSSCRWFEQELGEENVFRLVSKLEVENQNLPLPKNVWTHTRTDFVTLTQCIREKGIEEKELNSTAEYQTFMEGDGKNVVPLFKIGKNTNLFVMSGFVPDFNKGDKLLYVEKGAFT